MSSSAGRGLLTSEHGCIVLGVHVMINTEVLHLRRHQLQPRHLVRYQKSPRLARSTILRRAVRVHREYMYLRSHFLWYPGASSLSFRCDGHRDLLAGRFCKARFILTRQSDLHRQRLPEYNFPTSSTNSHFHMGRRF